MCYMGKPCYVARKRDLLFGDKVRIYPGMRTETQNGGKIIIGDNVSIGQNFHAVAVQNKLKIGSNVTISGANCDFTVSDCITINENEQVISQSRIKDYNIKTGFWRLMIKTRYLGCCMAFRRNVLDSALPFPDNAYLMEHDLWLAAVAECYFKTSLIDKPLIKYRRHGGNVSSGGASKGYSVPIKIYRRLYRLKCLFKIRKKIR